MKKLTSIIVATALAPPIGVGAPTIAVAKGNSEEVVECKALVGTIFETLGDCVKLSRSSPPEICRNLDEQGLLEAMGFKTRGDCVAFIRSLQFP